MVLRFLKGVLITILIFVFLDFFYFNLDNTTLGYPVQFEFNVPPFLYLRSMPVSLGFLVILSFCLGMLFSIVLGFFQALFRHGELRASQKQVKLLQKRVKELEHQATPAFAADEPASF